jgi:oxalate decarboxylase/phosphoglucose isomerase-like protein (cupin superfamily)
VRVTQFRGEQDGTTVRVQEVSEGEAVYIQQGTFHFVENISKGTTEFLQIFDHPQAGAVFAAPALASLPRNVVNSAFSEDVFDADVKALGTLIPIRGCEYW